MDAGLKAVELTGTIDADHKLHLDSELPVAGPQKVKVIVLFQPEDEIEEREWLKAVSSSPAFADLNDPAEDIYSIQDGKPFRYDQE